MNEIKVILCCGDSPNQRALANKMFQMNHLSGIILESKSSRRIRKKNLLSKILEKIYFRKIDAAWVGMLNFYSKKYKEWPKVDMVRVDDINGKESVSFIEKNIPDLICVSGTSLIKKSILKLKCKLGMINLHTGLSPYVKGGPNCTNWCLANNEPHLIGNTIMWLDEGIDSGNILTTERVEIAGNEKLIDIHVKVMEQAHDLYLKAISKISADYDDCPNIPQNGIAKGHLYYTKMWGWKEKKKLLKNMKTGQVANFICSDEYQQKKNEIITVPI